VNGTIRILFAVFVLAGLISAAACAGRSSSPGDAPVPDTAWICDTGEQTSAPHFATGQVLVVTAGPYMEWGYPGRYLLGIDTDKGTLLWKMDGGDGNHPAPRQLEDGSIFWNNTAAGTVIIGRNGGIIRGQRPTKYPGCVFMMKPRRPKVF
jgi:hypothetical protein